MMSKKSIKIVDFQLFEESVRPVNKIAKSAKITVNEFGLKINSRNEICRCEIQSNCVTSDEEVSFCIGDLSMLTKVLTSMSGIHDGDLSNVKMFVDSGFLKLESNRFKTKISLVNEDDIEKFVDGGFKTKIMDIPFDYEIMTNSNMIKRLNGFSFMFSDTNALRVYLKSEDGMNKNMIHATIGCDGDDFENGATFEFGLVTSGEVGDSRLVLNFDRLNILNIIQSDEIMIRKANGSKNLLECVHKYRDTGTYLDLSIVCSTLVK